MARFSHAAQDRRVLTTTVWEEALGPDMSTIQVYPEDPYRSHPNPSPTRRPRPDAYVEEPLPPKRRADRNDRRASGAGVHAPRRDDADRRPGFHACRQAHQ